MFLASANVSGKFSAIIWRNQPEGSHSHQAIGKAKGGGGGVIVDLLAHESNSLPFHRLSPAFMSCVCLYLKSYAGLQGRYDFFLGPGDLHSVVQAMLEENVCRPCATLVNFSYMVLYRRLERSQGSWVTRSISRKRKKAGLSLPFSLLC